MTRTMESHPFPSVSCIQIEKGRVAIGRDVTSNTVNARETEGSSVRAARFTASQSTSARHVGMTGAIELLRGV